MNQNKKDTSNQSLSCEICEINFMSHAEFALHEFTKKHCDNLIRLAKNKPVSKKQKTNNKITEMEKEPVKVNTVTHTGSFAKYGYFVPGEIYIASKDFNSDYDPYLQKYPERPLKEREMPLAMEEFQPKCTTVLPFATNAPKKKKKKSSIKICQICNVTLLTTPSYETHMKSPEHILKLKVSGMGVSAHFVKASSDLHTTETKEEQKLTQDLTSVTDTTSNQNVIPESSFLHCNMCNLVHSSLHQCVANASEKHDTNSFGEKDGEKEVVGNIPSDRLFCYTCNILLNTVFQYNEHKHGKKHKIKCRALIRKGMTVPPEERVPGIGISNSDPNKPVYPELYVKMITERHKKCDPSLLEHKNESITASSILEPSAEIKLCNHNENLTVNEKLGDNIVSSGIQNEINLPTAALDSAYSHESVKRPNNTLHNVNFVHAKSVENSSGESNAENISMSNEIFCANNTADIENISKESKNNITVLNFGESLHCSVCNENFEWQFQFDTHLTLEDHFKKIVELKLSGKNDSEILNLIFSDRNIVKPNHLGKLTCSICKVTVDSGSEFEHHLSCILHKYSEKDYKQRRTLEVKYMTPCDATGKYICKMCKIGLPSLVEFSQHLFSTKHKSNQKREKTSRSVISSQKQRLGQKLKRKYILLQSLKADENPSVGTKVLSVASDVCNGVQSEAPGSEPSEPKVEPTKNLSIGQSEKSECAKAKNNSRLRNSNNTNRRNLFNAINQVQSRSLMPRNLPMPPPLLPPGHVVPRFPNRPPHGWFPYSSGPRNHPPHLYSHPPSFVPFRGRHPIEKSFCRAPYFQRTPWRNHL